MQRCVVGLFAILWAHTDNGEHKKFAHLSNRPNLFLLYLIVIPMYLETSVLISLMNAKACATCYFVSPAFINRDNGEHVLIISTCKRIASLERG